MKESTNPILEVIEKSCKNDSLWSNHEKYLLEEHILSYSSEINWKIQPIINNIQNHFITKMKNKFSWLDENAFKLALMTYWDFEHSFWWNRLFLESKTTNMMEEWKMFSYASFDLNWMWVSNELSKSFWNFRILELSHISHWIVNYLKKLWYKESYFARTWWDEFALLTSAPSFILKNAFEKWIKEEIWSIEEYVDKEVLNDLLIYVKNTKWWKNRKECISKISWCTVWINSYDFNWKNIKNTKKIYKKITTHTDEYVEHFKSWKMKHEYKESILNLIKTLNLDNEKKTSLEKIINNLKLENKNINKTIKYSDIKKLWLKKDVEKLIIEKIEWYFSWESNIIVWNSTWHFKTEKENTSDLFSFSESNELSKEQNKNFRKLWKKLERNVKKEFYKAIPKRNRIIKTIENKKEIKILDNLLWKANFTNEEISKIEKITKLSEPEIHELKKEYMQALFVKWHYTGSYQPQVDKIINSDEKTWFSSKNKIVINTPSFKSINELSWHSNWDYFLMANVKYIRDELIKTFKENRISVKNLWKKIIIVSKWPNTEIFIKDEIVEQNLNIINEFKEKIKKSDFLQKINEKIWPDEDWETLLDKRINFIEKNQNIKIIDIKKEIILIYMWKNLHNFENKDFSEILFLYKNVKLKEFEKNNNNYTDLEKESFWKKEEKDLEEKAKIEIKIKLEKLEILK